MLDQLLHQPLISAVGVILVHPVIVLDGVPHLRGLSQLSVKGLPRSNRVNLDSLALVDLAPQLPEPLKVLEVGVIAEDHIAEVDDPVHAPTLFLGSKPPLEKPYELSLDDPEADQEVFMELIKLENGNIIMNTSIGYFKQVDGLECKFS